MILKINNPKLFNTNSDILVTRNSYDLIHSNHISIGISELFHEILSSEDYHIVNAVVNTLNYNNNTDEIPTNQQTDSILRSTYLLFRYCFILTCTEPIYTDLDFNDAKVIVNQSDQFTYFNFKKKAIWKLIRSHIDDKDNPFPIQIYPSILIYPYHYNVQGLIIDKYTDIYYNSHLKSTTMSKEASLNSYNIHQCLYPSLHVAIKSSLFKPIFLTELANNIHLYSEILFNYIFSWYKENIDNTKDIIYRYKQDVKNELRYE